MKLAITGHTDIEKAKRLPLPSGGKSYNPEAYQKVYSEIAEFVSSQVCPKLGVVRSDLTFVSGMARGVDEIFAKLAIEWELPLIAAVPNSVKWHQTRGPSKGMRAQAINYEEILAYPKIKIVEVSKFYKGQEYKYANFARNQCMVELADHLISYKKYGSRGTEDCIERAKMTRKYLGNVSVLGLRA